MQKIFTVVHQIIVNIDFQKPPAGQTADDKVISVKVAKAVKLPEIDPARTMAGLLWVGSADSLKAHSVKAAGMPVTFKKLPAIFIFQSWHDYCQLWPVGKVKIKAMLISVGPQPFNKFVKFCMVIT